MTKTLLPWTWPWKTGLMKTDGGRSSMWDFQKEMNDLFQRFWEETPFGFEAGGPKALIPKIDVLDEEKQIVVTAELPGMEEKDVDVAVVNDALTIKGEKKEEKEGKGKNYYWAERSRGKIERSIPLPAEVEASKAEATLKNGVLTVTIPKTAKAQKDVKRIDVKGQ